MSSLLTRLCPLIPLRTSSSPLNPVAPLCPLSPVHHTCDPLHPLSELSPLRGIARSPRYPHSSPSTYEPVRPSSNHAPARSLRSAK
jgi:hypothetical protein